MHKLNDSSNHNPRYLIEQFAACINGTVNDATLAFVHSVYKENPNAVHELINKFRNIDLQLDAKTVHTIIHTFVELQKIPHDAIQFLQTFLSDSDKQARLHVLQTDIATSSMHHQSVQHLLNSLAILTGDNIAEQCLRSILIALSDPKRPHKDTIKWLKTSLDIPYKSGVAQIVNVISAHIQLGNLMIVGKTRNMDGIELLLLFKNLTSNTKMIMVTKGNSHWIQQLHAAILALVIYNNSLNTFYDLVTFHATHPDFSLCSTLQSYCCAPLAIDSFIHNTTFKAYFPQQRYHNNTTNQHVFLSTMAFYLHMIVQDASLIRSAHHIKLVAFVGLCTEQFKRLDTIDFMHWYLNHQQFKHINSDLAPELLETIYNLATDHKTQQSGRIRANAMQLIGLGFSHRSDATKRSGFFQPVVNMDITATQLDNIQGFTTFLEQQSVTLRITILQEILLGYIIYSQHIPKLQSTPVYTSTPQVKTLTTAMPPATVPQIFRANPVNRNRMFTPKSLEKAQDKAHISRGPLPYDVYGTKKH